MSDMFNQPPHSEDDRNISGILTPKERLDKLERCCRNNDIKCHRIDDNTLHVLDESFVLATRKVRVFWVDVSDWSYNHLKHFLGLV